MLRSNPLTLDEDDLPFANAPTVTFESLTKIWIRPVDEKELAMRHNSRLKALNSCKFICEVCLKVWLESTRHLKQWQRELAKRLGSVGTGAPGSRSSA